RSHLFTLVTLAIAMSTAPAMAAEAGRLPSGGSEEFRDRMLGWAGGEEPSTARTTEVIGGTDNAGRLAISSPFGWRSDPIQGSRRRHAGVDLPGPSGARIFATGSGTVRFAGWARGYGKMVELEHPGGVRTRFGHLARIFVSPGTQVGQGQVIGAMGSTGRSTGTHLHYEVRVDGKPVNPLAFIGQTAARYDTLWSETREVAPRWAGWASENPSANLPSSRIR
ncbi:MAG TPA: peptidoglycan DD-metalloendopeptidase family protein, partial [Sphingomicrobium sp.]